MKSLVVAKVVFHKTELNIKFVHKQAHTLKKSYPNYKNSGEKNNGKY